MNVLRGWSAVAFLVVAGTSLAPLAARQQPTFRSGVDLVTVDATVLGPNGDPVDNLQPQDFQLKVDGQARRVVSAQFVSQAAAGTRAPRSFSPHFSSNEDADAGRLVVVAVDEAHIRRLEGGEAMRAAGSFIETLDPSDRIGVVGLTRLGALEFTRDRPSLKRRLGTLMGQTDPVFQQFNLGLSEALEIADGSRSRLADAVLRECGRALTEYLNLARAADDGGAGRDACPEHVEQESRGIAQHAHIQARISLSALESLLVGLKDIGGAKTLVLLSEGLIADPRRVDMTKVAAAAQAARVAIYVLHLEVPTFEAAQVRVSPTFLRDLQVRGDGLARVAGAARGAVFRLVGSDPRPFERIAREMSGYYLLAFAPLEDERDGRPHRIRLSLARGGGELRARPSFTLPATTAPASPRARDEQLVRVLRASAPATELPLRVSTYTSVEPESRNLRVVISAEAHSGAGGTAALLGFLLIDAGGTIAATAMQDVDAGRYAFSAVVAPGNYTLRVAAIDLVGRAGSVQRDFTARVAASDGVRISDLILAPLPARPDDRLEPIVDRATGAALIAYLEMHAATGAPLPDTVRIVITGGAGPPQVAAADIQSHDGSWAVAKARVPVDQLTPGRYTARAEVVSVGKVIAQVTRSFLIPDP